MADGENAVNPFDDIFKTLMNPLGMDTKPGPTDEQKEEFEAGIRKNFELQAKYLRVFTTPDGADVLRHLREITIENSTWRASLGLLNGIANGFAREGQNSLVVFIEDQIKAAKTKAEQRKQEAENERISKAKRK